MFIVHDLHKNDKFMNYLAILPQFWWTFEELKSNPYLSKTIANTFGSLETTRVPWKAGCADEY